VQFVSRHDRLKIQQYFTSVKLYTLLEFYGTNFMRDCHHGKIDMLRQGWLRQIFTMIKSRHTSRSTFSDL
jgi:hypothetical protein